jgi:formylglycine-generating enzyme required for sulfatase activity
LRLSTLIIHSKRTIRIATTSPEESEWELAARAGTESAYWWGDEVGKRNTVCEGCGSEWDNDQAAPVGSFKANPYGLYDTAGNVWEWTCSNWKEQFDGSENECVEVDNTAGSRVIRGGSWNFRPVIIRSSARDGVSADNRNGYVGFRAARTN